MDFDHHSVGVVGASEVDHDLQECKQNIQKLNS